MEKVAKIEKNIGISFKNKDLLQQAFVHRSYLNEHKDFKLEHNERLEFLGDACLELSVTDYLYNNFPNPEGELTNWRAALVRGTMISKVSRALGFEDHLLLSKGESQSKGKARELILANTFEAFLGAVYLDQGYKKADSVVKKYLIPHLEEILSKELYQDPKSKFQELIQEKESLTPSYRLMEEDGPDHAKVFTMGVYIGEKIVAKGKGNSKQAAEQEAAKAALKKYEGK